jgi:hypothetical protein
VFVPLCCCVSLCVATFCLWLFFLSFITNLTFHYLVMEIMQKLFIHNLYVHTLISCIVHIVDKQNYRKMQNLCDIRSFIGSYFIHQCLSMSQMCFQRMIFVCKMYEAINEPT